MPTKDDVINEILLRMPAFANASEANKNTCVEVAQFLSEGNKRLDRFTALEAAMEKEVNDRLTTATKAKLNDTTRNDLAKAFRERESAQPSTKLPAEYQKILSTVLGVNEQKYSFSLKTFLSYVPEADFRKQLREGVQFKDPTVPGWHGEFTHRIQWYMITASGGGLGEPADGWLKFYQWVGGVEHTKAQDDDEAPWSLLGLWDVLFDRNPFGAPDLNGPYNTPSETDFRSPENLNKYLVTSSGSSTYPLLGAFLYGRTVKRAKTDFKQLTVLQDYAAKKLFTAPYKNLNTEQKAAVDEKLKDNIL